MEADEPSLVVSEIWRYPVKSLGGETFTTATVTPVGIEGDRGWGLVDQATGKVLTARREPSLLFAAARLVGTEVVITLPDGSETADDAELSAWLERDVALVRAGDEGGVYENPIDPGTEQEWVEWQGPGLAWHDSVNGRLSLVSTSSLDGIDIRRIRANLVCRGAGEDALVGRSVGIGSATLSVAKLIDRCVMVTRAQPGLECDLSVLTTINRERGGTLSVGMLVDTPGTITVGDRLDLRA